MERLALALLLVGGSALSASAQAPAVPALPPSAAAPAAQAPQAAPKPPKLRCPCDERGFKALTPKGVALAEYWKARRTAKIRTGVAGTFFFFSLMAKSGRGLVESDQEYRQAMTDFDAARQKAVAAGAVKVLGDDLKDEGVEILAKPGVDYVIARPR